MDYRTAYHNGNNTFWGKRIERDGTEHVLSVALDMVAGQILFGWGGVWGPPMGTAFQQINTNLKLFPAISGWNNMKMSVNLGGRPFKYGEPANVDAVDSDVVVFNDFSIKLWDR
jgi:hypothetical protein